MKEKRTSIKIDPDTWYRAKIHAANSPMTVSELTKLALLEYIATHPTEKEQKTDKDSQPSTASQ